jgi:hypothetical protein
LKTYLQFSFIISFPPFQCFLVSLLIFKSNPPLKPSPPATLLLKRIVNAQHYTVFLLNLHVELIFRSQWKRLGWVQNWNEGKSRVSKIVLSFCTRHFKQFNVLVFNLHLVWIPETREKKQVERVCTDGLKWDFVH